MHPIWNLKAHERNEVYFVIFRSDQVGSEQKWATPTHFKHQISHVCQTYLPISPSDCPSWISINEAVNASEMTVGWWLWVRALSTVYEDKLKKIATLTGKFSQHVDVYFGNLFCHCRCLSNAMLLTYAKHSRRSCFTKQKTLRYAPCFICDEALLLVL